MRKPFQWFCDTLNFEYHWDRWFLSFFPTQKFWSFVVIIVNLKARNGSLSLYQTEGHWPLEYLVSGLAVENLAKLEIPEKGNWEKLQPRATNFPWILRQTQLLLEKLRDVKVCKTTRHMVRTVDLLLKFRESRISNKTGKNSDSRVSQTGFYSIEATHLEKIQLSLWISASICLVTQRWQFTLICLKNLPQSRFWKSSNEHWKWMQEKVALL